MKLEGRSPCHCGLISTQLNLCQTACAGHAYTHTHTPLSRPLTHPTTTTLWSTPAKHTPSHLLHHTQLNMQASSPLFLQWKQSTPIAPKICQPFAHLLECSSLRSSTPETVDNDFHDMQWQHNWLQCVFSKGSEEQKVKYFTSYSSNYGKYTSLHVLTLSFS